MLSKEVLESEIAQRNMHMFMYGKNNKEREQFLKEIASKHPFKFEGQNDSMCKYNVEELPVVYIDKIGIPEVQTRSSNLDKMRITRIVMSYLEFTIEQAVLQKINQANLKNKEAVNKIVEDISMYSKNHYSTLDQIIESMQKSREFYSKFYEEYMTTGGDRFASENFASLDISFVNPTMDINQIQNISRRQEPFQIILDRKEKISLASVRAINTFLNMRCNGAFSVKVACEPDEWETNADLNGSFPEYIHDYDIVELDNSYREHLNKTKAKMGVDLEL